jgi:hypothetical protein
MKEADTFKKIEYVKLSLYLISEALCHEDIWGS